MREQQVSESAAHSTIWLPDHFRDREARTVQIVCRLGLLLLALGSMWQYGLVHQTWLFVPLTALSGLFVWSIPTPLGMYTGVWLAFVLLRGASDDVGLPKRGASMAEFDRVLAGGEMPSVQLQQAFYVPGEIGVFDLLAVGIHASFFIVPHAGAVLLWWRDRASDGPGFFPLYLYGSVLVMAAGVVGFILIPVSPPWMMAEQADGSSTVIHRIAGEIWAENSTDSPSEASGAIGDANPVAAFPSLHMAIPLALALALWRWDWRFGVVGLVYCLAMGFTLIYLGEHYLVDILAGVVLTLAGISTVLLFSNRWRSGLPVLNRKQHPISR